MRVSGLFEIFHTVPLSPSAVALTSALRLAVEGLCEGDGGGAAPLSSLS